MNDVEEHEESTTCWCCPEIQTDLPEIIVIHNAFDGRTLNEKNNETISNKNENIKDYSGY